MAFIRRPSADAERIKARVEAHAQTIKSLAEGSAGMDTSHIVPLNPGFFALEHMRLSRAANKRQLREK